MWSGVSALATGAAALVMSAFMPTTAMADYPDHGITMVVAYDAGGSTDMTARLLAPFVGRKLGGVPVRVVNRPGDDGEVGFAAIADAQPDGYTIGFINSPNVIAIPIQRGARFSLDRLDPLINVIDDPNIWTVQKHGALRTIADAVTMARGHPKTVSVGTSGIGSDDHFAMLILERLTGIRFRHVPFSGSAAARAALLGGTIEICIENLGDGLRGRDNDPVQVLGVMSHGRWPAAPGLQTFTEQGYTAYMSSLRGIAAPRGLPDDVRAALVAAITAAVTDPGFVALAGAPETFQPLRILSSDQFLSELTQIDAEMRTLWQSHPWVM